MYTNETTHFGIPLPLGSDLTTPMDYNTAAEAVDEALFGAQGDAATANENAAAAVETANAVSEALDALSATVGGHTSQISALGARMTNAENNIDDVRSDLEDMIVAFNEPTATSTHAYAIGDYFIYNDVLYKATAAIAIGDTIVPNTNCTATNVMTEVAAGGGGSVEAADVTLAPITGMSADDVQEGIEELKTGLNGKEDKTGTIYNSNNRVILTNYSSSNRYTCTSDGYVNIDTGSTNNNAASYHIYDSAGTRIGGTEIRNAWGTLGTGVSHIAYIKKGMQIYGTCDSGGFAVFCPLSLT